MRERDLAPVVYKAYRYHLGDDFLATEVEDLHKTALQSGVRPNMDEGLEIDHR